MSEREQITEEWLKSVGFKWTELQGQGSKHWLLWIGDAIMEPDGRRKMFSGAEDLGLEIAANLRYENRQPVYPPEDWFCWFRSDSAGRYHRFIHLRHILYQDEVIALYVALTGQPWNPENHLYGSARTPEHAAYLRKEAERLDRRANTHPWTEAYKDPDRCRPLPEHVDAAVEGGKAK